MRAKPTSRVVYSDSSKEVVVKHKDREIAKYRNAKELVEVHMKGIMAIDPTSAKKILEIYQGEE